MNRIIIDRNKLLPYEGEGVSIQNGVITFFQNGDYCLEYLDSSEITLDIIIKDKVTVKLFIWSTHQALEVRSHYQLGRFSNLILFQFYCNKQVKEEVIFDLKGEYSKVSSSFSSISGGKEQYHMVINHQNHHVSSSIYNKCIGLDKSQIHMQIDSVLDKGNIDCTMNQNTRILTLGDVDAKIIPNMFIREDSVEARHGAVIGSFKDEEIFYLMSRGITEKEAIILLVKGFIFSNLTVDLEKREKILNCIQKIWR